jgi:hypothetical protein
LKAEIEVVEAPPLPAKSAGGYGSAILARPGTSEVVFTRQMGTARPRWIVFDVEHCRFEEAKGFPGHLRDGVFDSDGAWLLGTYGLARVAFNPPALQEILTRNVGSYQHRLLDVSATLLGIVASEGKTVAILDTERRRLTKRLRMPAPDLVVPGERPVLCAFPAGEARELDLASLRLARPAELPKATSPLLARELVFALAGGLAPYGRVVSAFSVKPAGYAIEPDEVVVLEANSRRTLRAGGDARGLVELLGTDADDRLVASATWGFALVDPDTFHIDRIPVPHHPVTACWVSAARTGVILLGYLVDPPRAGFDPVPEKLVLVRW